MEKSHNMQYQMHRIKTYDSRIGGHGYAAWTNGYVVAITDQNGNEVCGRFGMMCYPNTTAIYALGEREEFPKEHSNTPLEKFEIGSKDLFREFVNHDYRWDYIEVLLNDHDAKLRELLNFERADELTQKGLDERSAWKMVIGECLYPEKEIYKENDTRKIQKLLEVGFLDNQDNAGKYSGMRWSQSERDWLFKIDKEEYIYDGWKLKKYEDVIKERKEFGANVAKLAKELGVDWEDAKLFYKPDLKKSDVEQLKSELQTAREMVLQNMRPDLNHELFGCGKYRQEMALRELLDWDNVGYQKLYFPSSAYGMWNLVQITAAQALHEYNKDIETAVKSIASESRSVSEMKRDFDLIFRNLGNSGCLSDGNLKMLKTGEGLEPGPKEALLAARQEYCKEIMESLSITVFIAENTKYNDEVVKAFDKFANNNYPYEILNKQNKSLVITAFESLYQPALDRIMENELENSREF